MGECTSILYTVIILRKEVDAATLIGSIVKLEIDETYTIGKSIAVLKDAVVIGHLERHASRVVWRFLRSGAKVEARIYSDFRDHQNQAWFIILSHSFEIGVKVQFCNMDREDSKLLLAHFTRKKLLSFPGVSAFFSCPKN